MRFTQSNSILRAALWAVTALLAGSSVSVAQQVNLTAAPGNAILPDGQAVPMWGYSCDASPAPTLGATCTALNPNATGGWSPVLITVPAAGSGASLTIHLTNGLPATLPTSITIVGTLGGGLVGGPRTPDATPSPAHAPQGATWPIAGDTTGATLNPPVQANRVQSFGTRVDSGSSADLAWTGLQPGTYLIESGTHPSIQGPMGLYGVLVVTTPAGTSAGTAYTNIKYNAEVVALLSEIDPTQNRSVAAAVSTPGFSETSIRVLRDSVSAVVLTTDASGNVLNAGSGYQIGDVVTISGGGATSAATAHVDNVDAGGAIVSIAVDTPGSGYSSVPAALKSTITRR